MTDTQLDLFAGPFSERRPPNWPPKTNRPQGPLIY